MAKDNSAVLWIIAIAAIVIAIALAVSAFTNKPAYSPASAFGGGSGDSPELVEGFCWADMTARARPTSTAHCSSNVGMCDSSGHKGFCYNLKADGNCYSTLCQENPEGYSVLCKTRSTERSNCFQ